MTVEGMGINGFGRIGRLVFRAASGNPDAEARRLMAGERWKNGHWLVGGYSLGMKVLPSYNTGLVHKPWNKDTHIETNQKFNGKYLKILVNHYIGIPIKEPGFNGKYLPVVFFVASGGSKKSLPLPLGPGEGHQRSFHGLLGEGSGNTWCFGVFGSFLVLLTSTWKKNSPLPGCLSHLIKSKTGKLSTKKHSNYFGNVVWFTKNSG